MLDNDDRKVLLALARSSARKRLSYVLPNDLLSELEELIPASVVGEILETLKSNHLVRSCERDGDVGYAITRKGFDLVGQALTEPHSPKTRLFLKALADKAIQQRADYIEVSDLSGPLGDSLPVAIIVDYLTDLETLNLVRSRTKGESTSYALTRRGFDRLRSYEFMDQLRPKLIHYLEARPGREGDVEMWLRMQGLQKENASTIAAQFVTDGILSRLSAGLYRLK